MADTKISGLPASTVPLAGTEVLPIVQSSTTKQVSIANVTAGRAVSALSVATTADTTPSSSLGAFNYGTLTYADVNHLATFQTTVNSYAQIEIQNSNAGAAASADMVVCNNNTTASTYYGDFGMNSSGWAGSGAFTTANNVYLTSTSADLAIGTTTANAIRFATNGSATDAATISSAGVFTINSAVITPKTSAFASLPAASGVTNQIYQVTDVGISGSLWQSNGTTWVPVNGKASLYDSSIPFVLPSSGLMGNNGALTLTTALQLTYTNAYVYLPTNAIVTGSTAGWYYAVFSSTTLATVYNNIYTSGIPTIPSSPTAFVTTGPGAYVQTTATIVAISLPVIGNTFGLSGGLSCCFISTVNNSANNKSIYPFYGASGFHQGNNITTQYALTEIAYLKNRNLTNKQIGYCITSVPNVFAGLPQQTTIDSTATQNFALQIKLAVATDYIVVESCVLTLEQ